MDALPQITPIDSLVVTEMKGAGATFTPNLDAALQFKGLAHKPPGEFNTQYQIIAGSLLSDPRIVGRSSGIVFVPALAWSTCEVVIVPFKATRFGIRVVQTLQSFQHRFPRFKVFVDWSDLKKRYVVHEVTMTPAEQETIDKTEWPSREQVLNALEVLAYESVENLAAANDTIRILLAAKEVE
jgi:hypothetical protein